MRRAVVYVAVGQNLVCNVEVARIEEVFYEPADGCLVIFDVEIPYTRRAREANLVYCSIQASWTLPVGPLRCLPTMTSAMPLSSDSGL